MSKLLKNLTSSSGAPMGITMCVCGHTYIEHITNMPSPFEERACRGCACAQFECATKRQVVQMDVPDIKHVRGEYARVGALHMFNAYWWALMENRDMNNDERRAHLCAFHEVTIEYVRAGPDRDDYCWVLIEPSDAFKGMDTSALFTAGKAWQPSTEVVRELLSRGVHVTVTYPRDLDVIALMQTYQDTADEPKMGE